MTENNPPKKPTAAQRLQSSKLRPTQLELLGNDVDLKHLYLALGSADMDIGEAVTDIMVDRTIEGASTVNVSVQDQDRLLLRSGRLSSKNDTEIDGLFFRLAGVKKNGSALSLIFEDRDIAVLRTYDKPIKQSLKTSRTQTTRAQFALRMLREVKELPPIPYVIPELGKTQPVGQLAQAVSDAATRQHDRSLGIPKFNDLTVKSGPLTEEMRRNANIILDVGASRVVQRKVLVMAIMCVIQESSITNYLPGTAIDGSDSVGCFQQRKSQGWPATRNVAIDAGAFYDRLIPYVRANPTVQYTVAVQHVQGSAYPNAYAQWRIQAERIVTSYGVIDGTSQDANSQWAPTNAPTGDYEFYRGLPPASTYQKKRGKVSWGKESSWAAMQRLASEVQWRAFFVSGTFYFISEDDLFKSQPIATIDEGTEGVLSIDGDYDENKKVGTVTVSCLCSRWAAPPGSIIQLENMGPWNGRWLVNDINRSLFNPEGTVTLKKPLPRLPEPAQSNLSKSGKTTATWTGSGPPVDSPGQRQYHTATALVQPIPHGFNSKIIQGVHDTVGLPGYPAADFGADAGAPVVAVENGKIVKLSGQDPALGPWDPTLGVHGPFGLSIYLLGDSGSEYYYTHLGSRSVVKDERVIAGEKIATVGNYATWGGANHAHVGVHPGSSTRPDVHDLMAAPQAVK